MQREPRVPARWRLHAAGPFVFIVAALVAACGGGGTDPTPTPAAPVDGTLTIRAFEWGYEPEVVVVPQGEEVRIVVEDDGAILHNFKIEDLPAADITSESKGPFSAGEGELFVGVDTGEQGTLTFTPLEPGSYAFFCTISGHRDFGMEGTLIVEPN